MKSKIPRPDSGELQAEYHQRQKSLLRRLGWYVDPPLLWGVDIGTSGSFSKHRENHLLLKKKIGGEKARKFLEDVRSLGSVVDADSLLNLLQIAYSLDHLGKALSAEEFQELLTLFLESIDSIGFSDPISPWAQQMAQIELPVVMAVQSVRPLANESSKMDSMIEDLVDGDGWIVAKHVGDFVPLLCSWARCARLMEELGLPVEDSASLKLEWMARQWLRAMRPDGTALLGPECQEPTSKTMQAAILNLSTDREDRKLARLRTGIEKKKAKDEVSSRIHDGAGFSEWAGVGVLQCGWKSQSPRVAIAVEESGIRLELANRTRLLNGSWDAHISVNDKVIKFDMTDHELNCYHSDEEVEFLELEYKSKQGVVWQRQILLARDEQFLLLSDAVLLDKPANIQYRSTLPISPGTEPLVETDNREVYLKGSEIHALVLPLALGEWNSDRMPGGLGASDDQLTLEQHARGKAVYCPLFIDLSPRRCTSPRTWRSLTVAEELKILDRDQAVAFRVQVDEQQWVIYRSLSGIANRTFLGENQICEFFVGTTDGEVAADELIQIE